MISINGLFPTTNRKLEPTPNAAATGITLVLRDTPVISLVHSATSLLSMSHKIRLHGDLTTTRIIRLLRPLRTKCESLSASPSKPGVSVTYASSSRRPMESSSDVSTSRHAFSLTALPPPERMHSLKYDRELLQLSRKIYDIKDAFHNVIQSALGTSFLLRRQSQPSHADETESRVLGLAAMCSTIVGEHIEAEVKASQETMNTVSAFEDGDISVITELYDAIPAHHRR